LSYEHELEKERKQLQTVRGHIEQEIQSSAKGIKLTDDFTELALNEMRQKELIQLQKSHARPFFAKVDFQEDDQPYPEQAYIGRFGLYDKTTFDPLVMDWRSPMAHLYYDHQFENVKVEVKHAQELSFQVHLKRQFEMEQDEIVRYFDMTSTVNTNQLLIERLHEKGDQKLKDIVETIQAEQNEIIRADAHQVVIVQGVAGSGKTTIALHRLAYLAYLYKDRGTFDNFLIIAPNRLFIDYISNVLPELGVDGVVQTTWEDHIIELLPKKWRQSRHQDKIAMFLESSREEGTHSRTTVAQASLLRGTMAMKPLLEKYIQRRVENMIPSADLILDNKHRMSSEEIYQKFHRDFQHYPYMQRRKRLIQVLSQWKEDRLQEVIRQWEARLGPGKYAQIEGKIEEIKKEFQARLDEYCRQIKGVEIHSFYENIITKASNIAWLIQNSDPTYSEYNAESIANYLTDSRKPNQVDLEDLAALFYLTYRFYGIGKVKKYSHIVVDEAQDFAPFQMHVLGLLSGNQSISILGDLSQSIYSFKGLTSWDTLKEGVFEAKVVQKTLKQSYRSTVEIISVANEVLKKWNNPLVTLAKPVIRHGDQPMLVKRTSEMDMLLSLSEKITRLQQEGFHNIAIIDKTLAQCSYLYEKLTDSGLPCQVISSKDSRYEGGISIVPIYLSKGMEFDAVILVNPTADKYDIATPVDIKLLYVAMTRALHRLYIFHFEEPSPILAFPAELVELDRVGSV
jgi:DNA helicase-2/ATP-dependent DNA helicase PcrA